MFGSAWDTRDNVPSWYDGTQESLPPDWTDTRDPCSAEWRTPGPVWVCTRRADHKGRHAAGTGRMVVAEWSDADTAAN